MSDYFRRVASTYPTRLWVNNPTAAEAEAAIAAGAFACTTNPGFSASLLRREPAVVAEAIAACADQGAAAADQVQQRLIGRLCRIFLPLYERSGGRAGFVSIQGDPHRDDDAAHVIDEARRYRRIAPNAMAKIPVTAAGLQAIETMLGEGMPVIATEVFAVAQALAVAEVHQRVARRIPAVPPLYITHITGIFDEYLAADAARRGLALPPETLAQAGWIVARTQYRLLRERGCDATLLGGGARNARHFTDMVGGRFDVTLNPGTIAELQVLDPPLLARLDEPIDEAAARALRALPDFALALDPGALRVGDFAGFGPVRHFLAMFIAGWDELGAAIARHRNAGSAHG